MRKQFTLEDEFVNPKLETGLLAAIRQNPSLFWEVLDILPPKAFAAREAEFKALADAIEKEADELPAVEGEPLDDPMAAARKLADLYLRQQLAATAEQFLTRLRQDERAAGTVAWLEEDLARAQRAVRELTAGQAQSLKDILPRLLEELRERWQAVEDRGDTVAGLPTGFNGLDNLLGGWQAGIHLLAGEPGVGKTSLVLQIASSAAATGVPVLVVSFEETPTRLTLKILGQQTQLEPKPFADGRRDPAELERLAGQYVSPLVSLYIQEGSPRLTVQQVRGKCWQIMSRHGSDRCLLVVDYLQRWAAGRRDYSEYRHVVSGLVSELRALALKINSPVVVISSQNRQLQGRAVLPSLKESGDLEYTADSATFLSINEKRVVSPPARAVDLSVQKNRYGDIGVVRLIFKPQLGLFVEV